MEVRRRRYRAALRWARLSHQQNHAAVSKTSPESMSKAKLTERHGVTLALQLPSTFAQTASAAIMNRLMLPRGSRARRQRNVAKYQARFVRAARFGARWLAGNGNVTHGTRIGPSRARSPIPRASRSTEKARRRVFVRFISSKNFFRKSRYFRQQNVLSSLDRATQRWLPPIAKQNVQQQQQQPIRENESKETNINHRIGADYNFDHDGFNRFRSKY